MFHVKHFVKGKIDMIKIERSEVFNLEHALRGMRNPLNSWGKSDSDYVWYDDEALYQIGEADMKLCKNLVSAGTEHRKFMRQIVVSVDITAPLYLWKEFDTYKVGTTANSTSTMHKIHSKPFEASDFSCDHLTTLGKILMDTTIITLEELRKDYLENNDKEVWYTIIQLLPSSYNQTRTVLLNYEVLLNMYFQRKNHKLQEWHTFCDWIICSLPYMEQFIESAN